MYRFTASLIALSTAFSAAAQEPLPDLIARVRPSVVTIICTGSLGHTIGHGSGFFISESVIATNWHVVEGASDAKLRMADGREVPVEGLVAFDTSRDLALLSVTVPRPVPPPLSIASVVPAIGESVVVIGTPVDEALGQSVSTGIVSGIRDRLPYGRVIQTTAPISGGNSGGPLLSARGQVLGVITFSRLGGDALNFAVFAAGINDLKRGPVQPLRGIIPPLDSTPVDVPDTILDQLSASHRAAITDNAQWYLRLPNGGCIHAYGLLRAAFAQQSMKGVGQERELEALGMTTRHEVVLEREGVPPAIDDPARAIAVGPFPGAAKLHVRQVLDGGVILGTLDTQGHVFVVAGGAQVGVIPTGAATPVLVRGRWRAPPREGHTVDDALVLFPLSQRVEGQDVDAFQMKYLDEAVATPAQLAFSIKQGTARLAVYSYTRSSHTPMRTVTTGNGWGPSRQEAAGPTRVSYKWKRREVDVAFRDAPAPSDLQPAKLADDSDLKTRPLPLAPDRIRLRDGRSFSGRLVSESSDEVRFVIVIGRIESESAFPRAQVERIEKGR